MGIFLMKWIETKIIIITAADPDTATSLVADIFSDFGLQGVALESPDNEPGSDWADDAPPLPDYYAVTGYFPKTEGFFEQRRLLEERLDRLKERSGIVTRVTCTDIDEENWAEFWKAHFNPIRISDRIVVKPTWRDFSANSSDIVIEIDPGMAFGTGTHPTTDMCLRLIERHLKAGDRLLDIGTGSGILMIAAAKLGASSVTGIDSDPVAVEVATANLMLNRIDKGRFAVRAGDLAEGLRQPFDLIVANILSEVILRLADRIPPLLAPGGTFICSGITVGKQQTVAAELVRTGFTIVDRMVKEDWSAMAATHAG